jgi:hypothetical protein
VLIASVSGIIMINLSAIIITTLVCPECFC